jgi:hypothetical protein
VESGGEDIQIYQKNFASQRVPWAKGHLWTFWHPDLIICDSRRHHKAIIMSGRAVVWFLLDALKERDERRLAKQVALILETTRLIFLKRLMNSIPFAGSV